MASASSNGNGAWPQQDQWLRTFLENEKALWTYYDKALLTDKDFFNHEYWELVSKCCNGLDVGFLRKSFAQMQRWFLDKPSRKPLPRNLRRYVGDWLERDAERERRYR